nr:hypothetical protein [Tanacetum cinerariifolium]
MAEQSPPEYTVNEALMAIGNGKFQINMFLYAVLGSMAKAMELTLLTYIRLAVEADLQLTSSEENLISIVTYVGIILGAWIWSAVSDSFGRKNGVLSYIDRAEILMHPFGLVFRPGFLGSTIVTSLAGLISYVAPNYVTLLILCFIVGLGLGDAHVFTTWFMEFVPTLRRGAWMITFFVSCSIGTSTKALLAWGIMERYGWRLLLGVSSLPSLIALLFYTLVPKSPRFLYAKGELGEASKILNWGAELNKRQLPEEKAEGKGTSEKGAQNEREVVTSQEDEIKDVTLDIDKTLAALRQNLITGMDESISQLVSAALLTSMVENNSSPIDLVLFKHIFMLRDYPLKSRNIIDPRFYKDVFIISLAKLPRLFLAYWTMETLGRKMSMAIMLGWGFIGFFIQVMDQ